MRTKWDKYEIRKYLMSIDPDLQFLLILSKRQPLILQIDNF